MCLLCGSDLTSILLQLLSSSPAINRLIGLCQATSHSGESKCILGIAAICEVSKPRCSVFGEWSFSFASKWYVLVVLTSAIVNCMNTKVKTSP